MNIPPPILEDFPQHPLFDMIEEGEVAIVGKNAYTIERGRTREEISLESLDELFCDRVDLNLSDWKAKNKDKVLEQIDLSRNLTVPQHIYFTVFPYFRVNSSKLDSLLGENQNSSAVRTKNNRLIADAMNQIEGMKNDYVRYYPPWKCEVPLYANKGELYSLHITQKRTSLKINGNTYARGEGQLNMNHTLVHPYTTSLNGNLIRRFFDKEFSPKDVESALKVPSSFPFSPRARRYSEGEIGFELDEERGDYNVTLRVPAFAVKSPQDWHFYKFNTFKIGTGFRRDDDVFMLNRVKHPFVQVAEKYASICIGGNTYPKTSSLGETVALRLKMVRDILRFGHAGSNPYNPLCKDGVYDYFKNNRTTKAKILAEGLPIFDYSK